MRLISEVWRFIILAVYIQCVYVYVYAYAYVYVYLYVQYIPWIMHMIQVIDLYSSLVTGRFYPDFSG